MTVEEKLKELGYEKMSSSDLYKHYEYKKVIEPLACTLSIFIDYEEGNIRDCWAETFFKVSTQAQIDNLQGAFNLLKDDLKELGCVE